MMGLLYAAGSIGCGYMDLLETLEVPFPIYLGEVEWVLNLGSQSLQTMIRSKRALPLAGLILGAHMLNAFGHSTVAIVAYLEGTGPGGRYSWEPVSTRLPHMPADAEAANDGDDEMTEAYSVPSKLVAPAQPPPPPASNWEAITHLVRISGG